MIKFLLYDSKGNRSITRTIFVLGSLLVNLKLLLSGIAIGELTFEKFSGSDYGMAMAALGAIYVLRKNPQNKDNK